MHRNKNCKLGDRGTCSNWRNKMNTPKKNWVKVETGNLPDKEFKVMIIKMIKDMWSRCLRKNSWLFFQLNQGPVLSLSCVLLFCDPVDCSPPGSSVHGVSRARILEWVVISFSRGSSWSRDWICTSCMYLVHCRQVLYDWATREAQGPNGSLYFIINS